MDDGLAGLGRRSALALVGAGVSGVATIATVVVASRTLSRSGTGEFFVAISLFAIVQGLCSFGAETGLQFFVPTMPERRARRLVWNVTAVSVTAGVVVAALVWLFAGPFSNLVARGESGGAGAEAVVRAIAILLPFAGLYEVAMGALRACDEILLSTVLDRIARPIVQVAAMLLASALSAGSDGLVLAWALPNVAAVVIAIALLARIRLRSAAARTEEVSSRAFWAYTGPRAVARIAQTLIQRLDVLILAAVASIEDAGVYGTVSRCMIAGVFIATALRQNVQPQLRRLIVRGDQPSVKAMYATSTTWLVLVTWPVYLAMITHAPLVMSVFGPDYVRGATALTLLCLAMLVASGCGLVDVVLLMLGRSWLSTINVLLALALNVILNMVLAPPFGMVGSAIAWVVAILTTNVLPLTQTMRVGLHPGGVPLVSAMAVAVSTVMVPLAIERSLLGTAALPFFVTSIAALGVYAGSLYALRRRVRLDRLVADLRRPRRLAHG